MIGLFLLNLILALTWAALQGELNAANFAIGFLISAAIIYLFRRMFFSPRYFRKTVLGLRLTVSFIKELIKSNIAVLRVVISPRLRVRSGQAPACGGSWRRPRGEPRTRAGRRR